MRAIWNGQVVAESNDTVVVESNHYFPADSINKEFYADSDATSICPWKGEAHYYTITVEGKTNPDAAWYYPTTKEAAKSIEGRVAFWRGVEVAD